MLLATFPPETERLMTDILKQVKEASEVKRIQCVLFGARGLKSKEIAPMVGFNHNYVKKIWTEYRLKGNQILLGENRGRSRSRARLSLQEEKEFLAQFVEKAKTGGFLEVSRIKQAYEEKYQTTVKPSIIYKLLHRHGWRKITPRPKHPKADKVKQDQFKSEIFPPRDKKSGSQISTVS